VFCFGKQRGARRRDRARPRAIEAAQSPNMTVVQDRGTNVSTAQTEIDAAKNLPAVSIAPKCVIEDA